MPTTLTYGYVKPTSGDKGSSFFPVLEADIQQLNDHTHNGVDSALLTAVSVTVVTKQNVTFVGADLGGGRYRTLVTMPIGGMLYDNYLITARDHTTKNQIFATIEKVSANTFYVYSNDNTVTWDLLFAS